MSGGRAVLGRGGSDAHANAATLYAPSLVAGSADATGTLQVLISQLPEGGVLDGGGRRYTVTSLLLKSNMELRNIRFITKAGSTDFVSPVTIDGRPTIAGQLESGAKRNITLRNVHVDGNRANQTAIISAAENGGRHGFRFIGRIYNLLMEDCSGINCGTDGAEFYSWAGRNQADDDDAAFRDITLRRCVFTGNRRHGVSFDSLRNVRIEAGSKFNKNGLDIDAAAPIDSGLRGDLFSGHIYGNGIDVEGYGVGSGINGLDIDGIEALGNARMGVLFYDPTAQTATGFKPRRGIRITRSRIDKGVAGNITGEALTFTSTIANKTLGNLYDDITLLDNDLTGYLLLRAVGQGRVDGGSIDHDTAPIQMDRSGTFHRGKIRFKNNATPYLDTSTLTQYAEPPTNLTAPTAPTLTQSTGATGTLTLVTAQVLPTTPYQVSYRLVYDWTPSAAGGYTQFQVSAPAGFNFCGTPTPGAMVKATSMPVLTALGGGAGRFHTTNTTTDTQSITVGVVFNKT